MLPGRFISTDEAEKIVDAYLGAEFEGGRHQRRIDKMPLKSGCGYDTADVAPV